MPNAPATAHQPPSRHFRSMVYVAGETCSDRIGPSLNPLINTSAPNSVPPHNHTSRTSVLRMVRTLPFGNVLLVCGNVRNSPPQENPSLLVRSSFAATAEPAARTNHYKCRTHLDITFGIVGKSTNGASCCRGRAVRSCPCGRGRWAWLRYIGAAIRVTLSVTRIAAGLLAVQVISVTPFYRISPLRLRVAGNRRGE